MDLQGIKSILAEQLGDDNVLENADMSRYSSFRCGGRAALLVLANDMDALRYTLYVTAGADALFGGNCGCGKGAEDGENGCARKSAAGGCAGCAGCTDGGKGGSAAPPVTVIGNGSNILVRDGGYDGVIIKLGDGFTEIRQDGERLTAGAAALLSTASKEAARRGLAGMEFAGGIPASCGGAVYMNAGAYGGEMKDIVESVKLISRDGFREFSATPEELSLSYRHSALSESGDIVTEVTFALSRGDRAEIERKCREFAARRNAKQPLQFPSAGSFFKRPEGHFAGALIEEAGLKGLSVGGAQVSPQHAGFVVNTGGASAGDILALMRLVQQIVWEKSGVRLEPEVQILGKDSPDGNGAH